MMPRSRAIRRPLKKPVRDLDAALEEVRRIHARGLIVESFDAPPSPLERHEGERLAQTHRLAGDLVFYCEGDGDVELVKMLIKSLDKRKKQIVVDTPPRKGKRNVIEQTHLDNQIPLDTSGHTRSYSLSHYGLIDRDFEPFIPHPQSPWDRSRRTPCCGHAISCVQVKAINGGKAVDKGEEGICTCPATDCMRCQNQTCDDRLLTRFQLLRTTRCDLDGDMLIDEAFLCWALGLRGYATSQLEIAHAHALHAAQSAGVLRDFMFRTFPDARPDFPDRIYPFRTRGTAQVDGYAYWDEIKKLNQGKHPEFAGHDPDWTQFGNINDMSPFRGHDYFAFLYDILTRDREALMQIPRDDADLNRDIYESLNWDNAINSWQGLESLVRASVATRIDKQQLVPLPGPLESLREKVDQLTRD